MPLLIKILFFPLDILHVSISILFIVVNKCYSVNLLMLLTIVPLATRLGIVGVILVRIGVTVVVLSVTSTSIICSFQRRYISILVNNFVSHIPDIACYVNIHINMIFCHAAKIVFDPIHKICLFIIVEMYREW